MAYLASDPICSSAGCTQFKQKRTSLGYPIDYYVPHFGMDKDIIDTQNSIAKTEFDMAHNWKYPTGNKKYHNKAKDTLYDFNPIIDADIRTTQKNLKDAETNLNHHWVIEDLQTGADVNADAESDPICGSAGCTQYKHKQTGLGYDINYPVPHFGEDHDITDTKNSIALSEFNLGHKFSVGSGPSKKKYHNPAKDTMYNFAPTIDADIRTTQKNLQDAETKLNHRWVIEDV